MNENDRRIEPDSENLDQRPGTKILNMSRHYLFEQSNVIARKKKPLFQQKFAHSFDDVVLLNLNLPTCQLSHLLID